MAQIPGVASSTSGSALPPLQPNMSLGSVDESPQKASILPLVICLIFLIVSFVIYLLRFELGGGFWFFVGYALTPLLTSLTLGWDSVLQRNGRKNPWFVPSPMYSRIIRFAVALSFVLAVFHILEIAAMCGQGFVQSGVLCAS